MEFLKFLTGTIVMLILFSFDGPKKRPVNEGEVLAAQDPHSLCRDSLVLLGKKLDELNKEQSVNQKRIKRLEAERASLVSAGRFLLKAAHDGRLPGAAEMDSLSRIFIIDQQISAAH